MSNIQSIFKKVRAKIRHLLIGHLSYEHLDIERTLEEVKLALGKHEARSVKNLKLESIQDAEFKVFSQFGEDGIIQYLINSIPISNKIFIELGVGNYVESNTRFLLMNNDWSGKIVNCGTEHLDFLQTGKGRDIYYRHDIEATSAFIERENINELIQSFSVPTDIGILSIDLDGVDYWIWNSISKLSPRIIITEYNSLFGPDFAITVPYKKGFDRTQEHYSNLFFGASLSAFCLLAKKKGYQFVGSNSTGVNAFFVREDVIGDLPSLTAKEGYVMSKLRESKDQSGNLTYINDHLERLRLIEDKEVFDVKKGKLISIKKLFRD